MTKILKKTEKRTQKTQKDLIIDVSDILGERVYSAFQGRKLFNLYDGLHNSEKIIFDFKKVKFYSALFWNHFLSNIKREDFNSGKICIVSLNDTGKLLFSECFYD